MTQATKKQTKKELWRVEWLHNGQWRMTEEDLPGEEKTRFLTKRQACELSDRWTCRMGVNKVRIMREVL